MGIDLEYFQDVQKVYTDLTGLHIIIADQKGNLLTQQKSTIFELIESQNKIENVCKEIIQNMPKFFRPLLYDILPGVKIIFTPIVLDAEVEYYIFAGCFAEYPTKQSVLTYLQKNSRKSKLLKNFDRFIREYTPEEILEKKHHLERMAEILSKQLLAEKLKRKIEVKNNEVNEIFQLLAEDYLSISDLLKRFFTSNPIIDFIGYAGRISPVQFEIKECLPLKRHLSGKTFFIGEGLLGQVAALKNEKVYSNLELDPRSSFFQKHGIYPKSIFCFPVIQKNDIIGLFFGGTCKVDSLENEVMSQARKTAAFIKIIENKLYWQKQALFNELRATVKNEIFHFMTSLQSPKSIQMFLLDMSINLTLTPFVSIAFLDRHKSSINMVSRGLSEEKVALYTNDLTNRFLNNKDSSPATTDPIPQLTNWGEKVIEIPIIYLDHLYGYLCIGLNNEIDEEDLLLYKILSKAGGLALYLEDNVHNIKSDQKIDSIIDLLEFIDPQSFIKATRAKKILNEFELYLLNPEINKKAITYAFYLIGYDEKIIKKIHHQATIDVFREYQLILNHSLSLSEASINVQILVLIWTYIQEEPNIPFLSKNTEINRDLINKFILYLSRSELKISEGLNVEQSLKTDNRFKALTKRESEILKLVLKGKNNQEIADQLYISGHTVKNHMTRIFQKLNVKDRSQVIAKIYQLSL
ncbi:LuxR C-terminal-related transcriptional regulator [Cytobacillus sp. Hz8]|uniref:LuxR C-terminal-related transcriptional regulator n=1 Tax=Cytobacillus sp. Hz8 TaxID=3347168 RepID=UPI0035E2CA4E